MLTAPIGNTMPGRYRIACLFHVMDGNKIIPCPPTAPAVSCRTRPQQVTRKYSPVSHPRMSKGKWMRKVSTENINLSPLPVQQVRQMWPGCMTVITAHFQQHSSESFSQFPFFKRLWGKAQKKKLSQTISFYWRTYLFLGLTCYLATLKEAKICVEGWLWNAFLQLGASLVIKSPINATI